MAKGIFIVAHPPVMQVEWTVPPLQKSCASHDGNSQPPQPQAGTVLPDEALRVVPESYTADGWLSAVQALFAQEGAKWMKLGI
jgi:hypothetical protein